VEALIVRSIEDAPEQFRAAEKIGYNDILVRT
jgi:hypothetical protein